MNLKKPNLAQVTSPPDLLNLLVDFYGAFVELDGKRSPSKLPGLKAITAATLAGLRMTPGDVSGEGGPRVALLAGGASVLDGLQGAFAWDQASTARDDGSTVINPSGSSPGRWRRMVLGALNLALFTATAAGIVPASGGGTANFLRADGSWAAPPVAASTGRLLNVAIITSGTSRAKTAGCTFAIAEIWAGGGQGGGATATLGDSGEGGAAGGFAYFATSTIPATWTYAIGAGGSSGAAGAAGATGGNSTFSDGITTVTANGGPGGGVVSLNGLPGAAPAISTNGTVNGSGAPGTQSSINALGPAMSGSGGSSYWGGGGRGRSSTAGTDQAGVAAIGFASGGGGAYEAAGAVAKAGGAGSGGIIRLWEFS